MLLAADLRLGYVLAGFVRLHLLHKPRQLFNASQCVEVLELLLDLPHLRVLLAKPRILVLQILLEALKLHLEVRLDGLLILRDLVDHFLGRHAGCDLLHGADLVPHCVDLVDEQVLVHLDPLLRMLIRLLEPLSMCFILLFILDPDFVFQGFDLIVELLRGDARLE